MDLCKRKTTLSDGNVTTSWVDYNYYHIRIVDGNDADGDGIPDLSDAIHNVAPSISQNPQGQTVVGGETIMLSVMGSGSPVPGYQWWKDGTEVENTSRISGEDTANLVITDARRDDGGIYKAVASNSSGSADSGTANVQVRVPQRCLSASIDQNGKFIMEFGDDDGAAMNSAHVSAFTLQWSSDLAQWYDLPASLADLNGKLRFEDPDSSTTPHRFYRIVER